MLIKNTRNLVVDIFDYNNNKKVNLYDNSSNVEGQAFDVFIQTERNGWEELSLSIPSTIQTADGKEKNYRLDYLISDYKIRCLLDDEIKWFIISEDKIVHSKMATNISIVAGSTSQLLKTKNLGLEFSDDEGNNVGTAAQLLETIIEGTGWTAGRVDEFLEDDGTVKVRSLKANAKTGAFALISKMCELFEAKPIYHTNERTIDIIPMNPFAQPADGSLPEVTHSKVIELCYPTNLKTVTRTQNTSNLITKLYAYGSYGDADLGYCGLENATHVEHSLIPASNLSANTTYNIAFNDSLGIRMLRHFTPTNNVESGTVLIWSELDMSSMMYLYDTENECAYFLEDSYAENGSTVLLSDETEEVQNYFSFIMDFNYYKKIGLFTDNMLQALADYQRNSPALYDAVNQAAIEYNTQYSNLTTTIGTVDYCKLDVRTISRTGAYLTISLRSPTGIQYRTDYDKIERDQFKWRVATQLKGNGDPINDGASVVYAIRTSGNVTTWDKFYLKEISSDHLTLTTWLPSSNITITANDNIYLFSQNTVSGNLGAYEVFEETNKSTIDSITKNITVKHPVYFTRASESAPSFDFEGYAWNYRYDKSNSSVLYFCDKEGYEQEQSRWTRVYVNVETIAVVNSSYFYNIAKNKLYRGINGEWIELENTARNKRIFSLFSSVIYYCLQRDSIYKTTYDKYVYNVGSSGLERNNYYIYNGFGQYKLFSTTMNLTSGDKITYDNIEMLLTQTHNGADETIEVKTVQENSVDYQPENLFGTNVNFSKVDIDNSGKDIIDGTGSKTVYSTRYVDMNKNVSYSFSSTETHLGSNPFTIYFYDNQLNFISKSNLNNPSTFSNNSAGYFRLKVNMNSESATTSTDKYFAIPQNSDNTIMIKDEIYYYLSDFDSMTASGNTRSIIETVKRFNQYSDDVYINKLGALKSAQDAIKEKELTLIDSLHDIYREGYWQKSDYVEGDEKKLYKDAIDNLKEVSKPNVKYSISFLDLYGALRDNYPDDSFEELSSIFGRAIFDRNKFDYVNNNFYIEWPDITIDFAAHLIDDDLDINTWAFIDKLNKCYDQPWKTTLEINTNLSTIGQHTFTDVLTNIAEVANQLKLKESKYDKAAITSGGQLATERLEGKIDANKLLLMGGCSTWYTDDRGNIVFESGDGKSAMTLTGNGFCIANSKDEFGDWDWRTIFQWFSSQ